MNFLRRWYIYLREGQRALARAVICYEKFQKDLLFSQCLSDNISVRRLGGVAGRLKNGGFRTRFGRHRISLVNGF